MQQELRGSARLGNYLRRLRTGYGLSLRRVEDKARTEGGEIDNSQLSRYERGKCYPSFDKLCMLANIFNVPIQNFSDLLDLERIEVFEPEPETSYDSVKAEASREWDQGNYTRAYAIYERALAGLDDGRNIGRGRGRRTARRRAISPRPSARVIDSPATSPPDPLGRGGTILDKCPD